MPQYVDCLIVIEQLSTAVAISLLLVMGRDR
jgi:hypothetical protein